MVANIAVLKPNPGSRFTCAESGCWESLGGPIRALRGRGVLGSAWTRSRWRWSSGGSDASGAGRPCPAADCEQGQREGEGAALSGE